MDLDWVASRVSAEHSARALVVTQSKTSILGSARSTRLRVDRTSRTRVADRLDRAPGYDVMLLDADLDHRELDQAVRVGREHAVRPIVIVGGGAPARLEGLLLGAHGHVGGDGRGLGAVTTWLDVDDPRSELRRRLEDALSGFGDETADRLLTGLDETFSAGIAPNATVADIVGSTVTRLSQTLGLGDATPGMEAHAFTTQATDAIESSLLLGAVPAPAPAEETPPQLSWNSRFDDRDVLERTPHRVTAGRTYRFETALEPMTGAEGIPIDATDLIGKEVRFEVRAAGAGLLARGARRTQPVLTSEPIECTAAGTEPFRCRIRVGDRAPGQLRLDLKLLVQGGTVATHRIVARITRPLSTKPRSPGRASEAGAVVPADAIVEAQDVHIRLDFDATNRTARFELNSVLQSRSNAPDPGVVAANYASRYAALRRLSNLHPPIGDDPGSFALADPDGALLELARIGARLHSTFFLRTPGGGPPDQNLVQVANAIRAEGHGAADHRPLLEVSADSYPVPWGLLYDSTDAAGDDLHLGQVDPMGFWGRRFDIQRVTYGPNRPLHRGHPVVQAIVAPQAPGGEAHLSFVQGLEGDPAYTLAPVVQTPDGLLAWAEAGDAADLLYLFCHARPAKWVDDAGGLQGPMAPEESRFGFGASPPGRDDGVALRELGQAWWKSPRPVNPVVFANACSSGNLDPSAGAPFAEFFMGKWQAQAFIGTDWPISGAFADRFGRLVLDRLLHHRDSLREALRAASERSFEARNYFPVIYGLYGPCSVRYS